VGSCWRSEQSFAGRFANTDWTLAFRVRAGSAASAQAGRVKCRIWKSPNADGAGAVQLTSAILVGSTTPAIPMSPPQTSTAVWSPGQAIIFNNEYLFVQCEWEITTASANANSDVLFYVDAQGAITTPDLGLVLAPALYDDVGEKFYAPPPVVAINTLFATLHGDGDVVAAPAIKGELLTVAAAPHSDVELFPAPQLICVTALQADQFIDIDDLALSGAIPGDATIAAFPYLEPDTVPALILGPAPVVCSPSRVNDADRIMAGKLVGGKQLPKSRRLSGSMSGPAYMVGAMGQHSLKGSTGTTL
jgi:hypothetical protein